MTASRREQDQVAARRARVLELKTLGLTAAQIAAETGQSSADVVRRDLSRALAARAAETVEVGNPATLELERLDALERAAQRIMREALDTRDRNTALAAMDRLLRLSASRRGLLGIDAAEGHGAGRTSAGSRRDELADRRAKRRARAGS